MEEKELPKRILNLRPFTVRMERRLVRPIKDKEESEGMTKEKEKNWRVTT